MYIRNSTYSCFQFLFSDKVTTKMVLFWVVSLGDRKSVKSRILLTVSRIGLTGKRNYLFVFKVVSTTIKYCCNVYHQARKGTGTVLVKCVSEKGASN